jgi:hypothetical protein
VGCGALQVGFTDEGIGESLGGGEAVSSADP